MNDKTPHDIVVFMATLDKEASSKKAVVLQAQS